MNVSSGNGGDEEFHNGIVGSGGLTATDCGHVDPQRRNGFRGRATIAAGTVDAGDRDPRGRPSRSAAAR